MRLNWGLMFIVLGLAACGTEVTHIDDISTVPPFVQAEVEEKTQRGSTASSQSQSGHSETGSRQLSQNEMFLFAARSYQSAVPGISLEEAQRRMMLQADHGAIKKVATCAQEQGGFGGMVIVHRPDFEIAVFFTENEISKLAACTGELHFTPYPTPLSSVQLSETSEKVKQELKSYGQDVHVYFVNAGHSLNGRTNAPTEGPYVMVKTKSELIDEIESGIYQMKAQYPYIYVQKFDEIILTPGTPF